MPDPDDPLFQVLALSRRARRAGGRRELAFLAVNDTYAIAPYRQAALWFEGRGVEALSGVVEPVANVPYAQWLERVCGFLRARHRAPAAVTAAQLPPELGADWGEWLPPFAAWLPMGAAAEPLASPGEPEGGLLLAAEQEWDEATLSALAEWAEAWHHAWRARDGARGLSWRRAWDALRGPARPTRWWRRRPLQAAVAVAALMCVPVRLSVLAPGELVPRHPAVIRAPVDGVIGQFSVEPGQAVKAGQPLFGFDDASMAARQDTAAQALGTAQAEYRQQAQQAVSDARSKPQLAPALGKIEEKRAEADFYAAQLERSHVSAPVAGVALFDDPSDWIGKPVQIGERVMRIAAPGDVEVEAWLALGDAIDLPDGAPLRLYLASDPLAPLDAHVRYVAHDAIARPDGSYAYRVRATLDAPARQRVGLKGTAKLSGERVPLAYWMLRRPWSLLRQATGI
jgi:hypothetical protein